MIILCGFVSASSSIIYIIWEHKRLVIALKWHSHAGMCAIWLALHGHTQRLKWVFRHIYAELWRFETQRTCRWTMKKHTAALWEILLRPFDTFVLQTQADHSLHKSLIHQLFTSVPLEENGACPSLNSGIHDSTMQTDRTYAEADGNRLSLDWIHPANVSWCLLNSANWRPHKTKLLRAAQCTLFWGVARYMQTTCCPQTVPVHLKPAVLSALRSTDLEGTEYLYY